MFVFLFGTWELTHSTPGDVYVNLRRVNVKNIHRINKVSEQVCKLHIAGAPMISFLGKAYTVCKYQRRPVAYGGMREASTGYRQNSS